MAGSKRAADTGTTSAQRKRVKVSENAGEQKTTLPVSVLRQDEVDFPRGGGTSFTPVEYKAIRSEALNELKDEIVFKDSDVQNKSSKKRKRDRVASTKANKNDKPETSTKHSIRIEHLNYKRVAVGMKVLCQVMAIYPFHLIVSLPNQLLGHIPITNISTQLTTLLEANEQDTVSEEEEEEEETADVGVPPDLAELFQLGQYVRATVSAVKPAGTTEGRALRYSRDEVEKASRRVELSLIPGQVNSGLVKADLRKGLALTAAVTSVEDHGYILDFGLGDVAGFLRHKKSPEDNSRRHVGSLVDVVVEKLAEDGRTCIFTANKDSHRKSLLTEISNISSLPPGTLVQGLVTTSVSTGLVLQILGSFDGTIDQYHLPIPPSKYKVGQKLRARVLYDVVGSSPPQFALSLSPHIVALEPKKRSSQDDQSIQDAFSVGTVLESVKVKRVEQERGIVVSIDDEIDGFVHISHVSDDHVPSLSANSGLWKLDTVHRARVIGFHPFDGIVQLSLRPSVLSQKFLRVNDVEVGELVKGTVKKLLPTSLFVSINGAVDAMVWPNHYADILLKRPEKRFKQGSAVKCRILAVDPDRKRILLTAKKTLVESDLPIVSSLDNAEVGMLTYGVVCKVLPKSVLVELYNNLRAIIPGNEASDSMSTNLVESYPIGKPVKIRILSIDRDSNRIVASVRHASSDYASLIGDIKSVEVGQNVEGVVSELHRENALLIIEPSKAKALISLNNVANHRGTTVAQLRSSLKAGDKLENLVVVSRNLDKGFVIVANKPSQNSQSSKSRSFNLNDISVGSTVKGKVIKYGRHGAMLKFPGWVTASLHPTDATDDYKQGIPFPTVGTELEAIVIGIDRTKKLLTLSTRQSRIDQDSDALVVDREIDSLKDLKTGDQVRGFIKSVTDHGIFISIGRDIDARVQIKEMYDEYVKDWKKGFEANQLVKGVVVSVDSENKKVEMSFRTNPGTTSPKIEASFGDLVEGQKVGGIVKKVEEFGVFITIGGTKVTGLCHKSEIADSKDADVSMALRNFGEGDKVKAVILSIDREARRISLGLKPSYFAEEDLQMTDNDDDVEMSSAEFSGQTGDIINAIGQVHVDEDEKDSESASDDDDDDDDDENAMIIDSTTTGLQSVAVDSTTEQSKSAPLAPVLSLQGFQWNNDPPAQDDGLALSSDEDSDKEQGKKRSKKKAIEKDLTADLHTKLPESITDFERLLLASPSSSYMWIQYMAFQLQLAEIDKAREVAKRALNTINIREEQEKLNVWIALLNLENTYGTEESLDQTFKDAARYNDAKTVYLRLATIYDQSGKSEKAEELYKRTCKKFGFSSKVWTLFGEHYLRRGLLEEARKLLQRSLQSLEKRKHLKTISKFAQLEYKLGDHERGKTIFEGIVDSHPKRWDLWSIYIDMEAGQRDIPSIRNLFERVLAYKMTSHKAKSFFKKWLELERRIGDEEGQRIVKEKAIEWTQRTTSAS